MKIAICDDDKKDIARLKKLIKAYDADNNSGFYYTIYYTIFPKNCDNLR